VVRGIDKFREQFSAYAGQYVLIGGAACDLLMEEAGLVFRATKDLDIVLTVEALDASFVSEFWEFVRTGKYHVQQSATGDGLSITRGSQGFI
jgi:glutathionyl-hydroquinone reductase